MEKPLITIDPEIVSGTPVFAGMRVPVWTLVECLASGDSIDEFLEGFPSVSREQAVEFLERATRMLVKSVGGEDTRAEFP